MDSVYWMLSPHEDDRGRRLKLVRNSHGCRHTIASERTRGVTRSSSTLSRSTPRWGWRGMAPKSLSYQERIGSTGVHGDTDVGGREGADSGSGTDVVYGGDEAARKKSERQGVAGTGAQELARLAERRDVRAISAQTSLWQDLCKYQHKSVKVVRVGDGWEEGDDDVEEEEEEEEDEDDEEESLSNENGGEEEGGTGGERGEGSWDGPRKGRRTDVGGGGSITQHPPAMTFSSSVDIVRPFYVTQGLIRLLGHRLVFIRSMEVDGAQDSGAGGSGGSGNRRGDQPLSDNYRWALRPAPSTSWPTAGLRRVLFRPYGGLRFASLELWFSGAAAHESGAEGTLLLGLPSESLAQALYKELRRTRPPALEPFLGRLPATVVSRSKAGTWGTCGAGGVGMPMKWSSAGGRGVLGAAAGAGGPAAAAAATEAIRTPLTKAWVRRRCGVTNFDYLRGLNAAAGRTTADLSRYPVFPWVLSERAWRAEELDLKDERNFRDFAWPMGAQRPEKREVGVLIDARAGVLLRIGRGTNGGLGDCIRRRRASVLSLNKPALALVS